MSETWITFYLKHLCMKHIYMLFLYYIPINQNYNKQRTVEWAIPPLDRSYCTHTCTLHSVGDGDRHATFLSLFPSLACLPAHLSSGRVTCLPACMPVLALPLHLLHSNYSAVHTGGDTLPLPACCGV